MGSYLGMGVCIELNMSEKHIPERVVKIVSSLVSVCSLTSRTSLLGKRHQNPGIQRNSLLCSC